jgi:hypothetical protein
MVRCARPRMPGAGAAEPAIGRRTGGATTGGQRLLGLNQQYAQRPVRGWAELAAYRRRALRNLDVEQRPYTRLCGSARPRGSGRSPATTLYAVALGHRAGMVWACPGLRGWWLWRRAACGSRATTLYAAAWVGRPERVRGLAGNDPIRGCAGRPGGDGRGLLGTARLAVVVGRGVRVSSNDPIRGCMRRTGLDGATPLDRGADRRFRSQS